MTERSAEVLVVGEALIDVVMRREGTSEIVGGSPANVALGLGRRGVDVALGTQFADDRRGRLIHDHLTASGVRVVRAPAGIARTSTATATIAADGHADYVFDLGWEEFDPPAVTARRLVHTGSIAAFLEPGASSVRGLLRDTEAGEITFDPNIRPALLEHGVAVAAFEDTARLATVVKMSDEDAAWLHPGMDEGEQVGRTLALGPRLVVLTRGAHGAILATPEHRVDVPAVPVHTVDTIGAGDTFMASLIVSLLDRGSVGLSARELATMGRDAAGAAAITVGRAGADLPWARELG